MNADLTHTPGMRRFIEGISQDLAVRRTVLALIPATVVPEALWQAVRRDMAWREMRVVQVSLNTLPEELSPAAALSEFLQVGGPATVAALAFSAGLPDVLALSGFGRLPEVRRADWADFLEQWTQMSRSVDGGGGSPMALCLVCQSPLLHRTPAPDLFLALHWWWGILTPLDFRVVCRARPDTDGDQTSACWREGILPDLSSGDEALFEHLWETPELDAGTLWGALEDYAAHRGWTAPVLSEIGAGAFLRDPDAGGRLSLEPSVGHRRLWAEGLLNWTVEYGTELHAAALATLGQRPHVQHRIWRGQVAVLLPLLDQFRLMLCDIFVRHYGLAVPTEVFPLDGESDTARVRESPYSCDLGYLKRLFNGIPALYALGLAPLIRTACWVRNELAHYRPVEMADYVEVRKNLARLQNSF
jgi:hypothetical protein